MARLLPVGSYTDFSAGQGLLTVVGVTASALVPLPLARVVRAYPPGTAERRAGIAFATLVSLLIGVCAGGVLAGIARAFASPAVAIVIGASGFSLFAIMPVWGWLQGESRFGRYALLSLGEVCLRLALSVFAAVLGWGAGGALGGYVAGAGLVLVCGLILLRRDLAWLPQALRDRGRWLETGGIAAVQLVMSTLVSADVVLIAMIASDSPAVAGYQAVATLAKGPVYVAAGTVLVSFPALRTAHADRAKGIVRSALRSFACLALPAGAILATVPPILVLRVLPARYGGSLALLPWLATAGVGFGIMSVLAVMLLGLRAYRRSLLAVASSALLVLGGMATGWTAAGPSGLAIGITAGALAATVSSVAIATPYLPSGLSLVALRAALLTGALVAVLWLVRPDPWVWLVVVTLTGVVVLRQARRPSRTAEAHTRLPDGRLRITHLGFEDPAMPGAGGGSLRTHEIDRRLVAFGHTITALVTRFPGCVDRTNDGVHYVHIGIGKGKSQLTRLLGYAVMLPIHTRRYPADLVVEDFFAPISTLAAPLWSGRPTVAVVQWLNARDKARQYHLPVYLVERFGVRRHRHFIAVSDGVRRQLGELNPHAHVEVIGNGVDPAAFAAEAERGNDVVFVGRLETAHKGLDLLLQAWAIAASELTGQLVIAGRGPDEVRLRQLAGELGIAERVRFVGWVAGAEKYRVLAGARLVVVPSRFETFGIIAVEALATGTPVLAFDIPCLREVVPPTCGRLVVPFDVAAYAEALVRMHQDPAWRHNAAAGGRRFAAKYDWDVLAGRQDAVYRDVEAGNLGIRHDRATAAPRRVVREQLRDLGRRRTHGERPPRLTVVGNVGNGNTGDEALLAATLTAIDRDAEVTVLARRPDLVTRLHAISTRPLSVRSISALRRCDGLVVVGGGMFGPGLPPLVRMLPAVVEGVRRSGRAVAYVGIGVYPGTPIGALRRLRRAAERSEITVRDNLSIQTLRVRHPVDDVGDLAWQLTAAETGVARDVLATAGVDLDRPLLLLSAKAGPTTAQTEQLITALAAAARHWVGLGGTVVAIALTEHADHGRPPSATDRALAEAVATRADRPLPVVGPNLPPELAKAIAAQATAVVGLRFHALVFALSTGTACLGFRGEPKTEALLAEHPVPAFTDVDALRQWLDNTLAPTLTRR
jgi:glycosyltransferase involved in cell wall biosynthesis/polysaccharide pyruvyl transferase WcaK-like protein/O-antigen/teichoic acid export membrane protein